MGENSLKIIILMKNNKKISIVNLSKDIGISETAIENNIFKLKEKGIIKIVCFDKGSHRVVLE